MSQRCRPSPFNVPNGGDLGEVVEHESDMDSGKSKFIIHRKPVASAPFADFSSCTSQLLTTGSVNSSTSARTLRRDYMEIILSILTLMLPIPFFLLAFYAGKIEGKVVVDQQWKMLQVYMNTAVTAFPIVFATIAGRAAKKFAARMLEERASIGHLEQLMGSTSLAGTIISTISLRLFNFLTPVLLLVWALSPLGGQSSLHLITTQPRYTLQNVNVTYYDTRSQSIFAQDGQSIAQLSPTINAVLLTSIMEPTSAFISRRDLWSNVKIPDLASLRTSDSLLSSNWTNITAEQDLTYSSLLGVPLSGVPNSGQTSMTIETCYFTLVQDGRMNNVRVNQTLMITEVADMANDTWHWTLINPSLTFVVPGLYVALDGFNAADGNYSLGYDVYNRYSSNTEFVQEVPRRLAIVSSNYQYQRTYKLTTTYVETKIDCDGPDSCEATAIRISQQPHINSNLSNLAYSDTWESFSKSITLAVNGAQSGLPSLTEAYLNDPSNATVASIDLGDFNSYILTATDEQLQIRAQQLLNTFWQASVNPSVTTVGLGADVNPFSTVRTRAVEALHRTTSNIYSVSWTWWVAYMCATIVMLALAILTVTIDSTLRCPEVLGFCTTFLQDSPFTITGRGSGSTLGGAARARRWKDVMVKLMDVRAGDPVGYIAVAEIGRAGSPLSEEWKRKLPRDGRLYR